MNGKDYERKQGWDLKTVGERINQFRQQYGQTLSIITSIVHADDTVVRMKAAIVNNEGLNLATGHAESHRDTPDHHHRSIIENCETAAIGRALATFGMTGAEFEDTRTRVEGTTPD